jgi:hypothetical protein
MDVAGDSGFGQLSKVNAYSLPKAGPFEIIAYYE